MRRPWHWMLAVVFAAAGAGAHADVVQLIDGTRLEGTVRRSPDGQWEVIISGRPVFIAMADVQSITLKPLAGSTTQQADDRLASLRRSVAQSSDLNQIIARYHQFLKQVKEPAATQPATRELADYHALADEHAVKVGGEWLTPAQRQARVAAGPAPIEAAREALKENRLEDARAALAAAAALTPEDPAILYLRSLIAVEDDDLPAARQALDTLLVTVPNHAPTLNNLAVVQWRQRQFLAALSSYDAALSAAPQSIAVLRNIEAALASTPAPFDTTPVYQELSEHYQQQQDALAAALAQQGLQRFGDRWLPAAQVQQLEQHRKSVQTELDQISGTFDTIRQKIEQLDRRRADLLADRQRIQGPYPTPFSLAYTGEGALSSPLSSDLEADEQQDRLQRQLLVSKLDSLTAQAKQLQAQLAVPHTDGRQRLIGAEGTPFVVQTPAAPSPATQPTAS